MQHSVVNCQHFDAGTCRVASLIAGQPAATNPSACAFCLTLPDARQRNRVTVSMALSAVHADQAAARRLLVENADAVQVELTGQSKAALAEIIAGRGVGSHLWKLLSGLGIEHKPTCSCLSLARRMNDLGPEGCRADRDTLAAEMRTNAGNYGWGEAGAAAVRAVTTGLAWRLNPLDVYGSLLDEAIRLAAAEIQPAAVDVLLPIGPGSRYGDFELRAALRSIEKHARGLRRVVIVGRIPGWLRETDRVRIVPREEFRANKASRISLKVLWALEHLDLTKRIAFWNDDYLMLRPFDLRGIPSYFRGRLWRNGTDQWSRLLDHTGVVLRQAGLPVRHFDIHIPILLDREKFLALSPWWKRSRTDKLGYVMKSVYGNHYCRGADGTTIGQPGPEAAISAQDCKLKGTWKARIDGVAKRRWVLSYGDAALQAGLLEWIEKRFPEPCAAERAKAKACC
jgi:hypothetical protein